MTASMRSSGSSVRGPHRGVDHHRQLLRGGDQHRLHQLVLAREPVQQRLLGDADLGGDHVERHGVDAACAEQVGRGVEDSVAGRVSSCLSTIW